MFNGVYPSHQFENFNLNTNTLAIGNARIVNRNANANFSDGSLYYAKCSSTYQPPIMNQNRNRPIVNHILSNTNPNSLFSNPSQSPSFFNSNPNIPKTSLSIVNPSPSITNSSSLMITHLSSPFMIAPSPSITNPNTSFTNQKFAYSEAGDTSLSLYSDTLSNSQSQTDYSPTSLSLDIGMMTTTPDCPLTLNSAVGSSSGSLNELLSPFSGTANSTTAPDLEHPLINGNELLTNNYSVVIRRPDVTQLTTTLRDNLQSVLPGPSSGANSSGGGPLPPAGYARYKPISSLPRSRRSSECSIQLEELPVCEEHKLSHEFFCYDCNSEVCVDCIKSQHNEHFLMPGLTCKQMFEHTEKAKVVVRDNIATVQKQLSSLQLKKLVAANNIKMFFQYLRDLMDARETELLNDVAYIVECRAKILEQKLEEHQEALNQSNVLMERLVENYRSGDNEVVSESTRDAMRQLERLRRLQRINVQTQNEDVVFYPAEDDLLQKFKEIGTIACPSYVASFSANNRNTVHDGHNDPNTNQLQPYRSSYSIGGHLSRTQPPSNSFFDNSPQYHPFQSFMPPSLTRTLASSLPPTNVAPPVFPQMPNVTAAASETTNPLTMLAYVGNPVRDEIVPHLVSPLATSSSSLLPVDNPNNMFPVSFHTRRAYHRIKKPVTVIGKEGAGEEDLCRPWGVCCDNNGHVIIADRSNNRIQIFRSDGSHVKMFGSQGSNEGEFNRPAGVAIDYYGRIVVTDKDNHRVQVFTMEGEFVFAFGERGQANGKFHYPWDVDVNSSGVIAISDTRNHRVQLFSGNGVFFKKFGFENMSTMWKFFDSPRGVCFTPENTVMVTDFNNHKLYEIEFGKTPRMVRAEDYKKCELFRPQGVAMDADGHILVADCRNNRIQVFRRNAELIGSFGVPGKEVGQFDRPSGIALTPDGKIVVVDFGNHRIQIF